MQILKISKKDDCKKCIYDAIFSFLKNTGDDWNYVLPSELNDASAGKYFLLDTREPEAYKEGHIKGAINIFWLDLLENLDKLPKDKTILVICYVGHTASQVMVVLNLLGYKAKALKFGMGKSPVVGVPIAGWLDYGYDIEK